MLNRGFFLVRTFEIRRFFVVLIIFTVAFNIWQFYNYIGENKNLVNRNVSTMAFNFFKQFPTESAGSSPLVIGNTSNVKTILLWTSLFGNEDWFLPKVPSFSQVLEQLGCQYQNCLIIKDKNKLEMADVVLVYLRDFK